MSNSALNLLRREEARRSLAKRVAELEAQLAAANEDAERLAKALGYAASFCAGYLHGADDLSKCGGCKTGKCDEALRTHEERKGK